MVNPCLVGCGKWKCDVDGEWEFLLDKGRLPRNVLISDSVTISDLCNIMVAEFGEHESLANEVKLSYLLQSLTDSSEGRGSCPVFMETNVCLGRFSQIFKADRSTNMFVTFSKVQSSEPLKTPSVKRKRNRDAVEPYVPVSVMNNNNTRMDIPVAEVEVPEVVDAYSTPTKNGIHVVEPTIDLNKMWIDEEDLDAHFLFKEVEALEEEIHSSSKKKGKRPCLEDLVEVESDDEDDLCDGEESDVMSRGYDKDFWNTFLDEEYGCSNAVDIMCNMTDAFLHRASPEVNVNNGGCVKGDTGGASTSAQMGVHSSDYTAEGQQAEPVEIPPRLLKEIRDEEFDIPPLFGDTTYEFAEIPDLDADDVEISEGKMFRNKSDCQIALAIYAIRNMFYFKQTRTTKEYFVANCADPKCDWRVSAHKLRDSCYYKIKKASLDHTCNIDTRSLYKKKATVKVIAAVYKSRVKCNDVGPKPKDIQQLVLEDLRVSTNYSKCWKVKESGNEEVRGSEDDAYAKLSVYLYALKLANPGTIADVETVTDLETGRERFLYVFLAFGASIRGSKHLRRVIVIDGTHLNGKYKGVLLTASGQDANFQVFPLAFAVVDAEDDNSWTWFLTKVRGIIADSPTVTIISDRHQSIYTAKKAIYPEARHGACVVHLARNVAGHFKSKGLGKLMVRAACAYRVHHFVEAFKEIQTRSIGCAKYLEDIGRAHWSRAYCPGDRYNMMTSNVAESLNNALRKGRDSSIIELLMFIQAMLTRWFSARRKKAEMNRGFVTPEVDKLIIKNLGFAKCSEVSSISEWSYEVVGQFGGKYNVDLSERRCSCRKYDLLQIPCSHALVATNVKRVSYQRLTGSCYRSTVWVQTYAGVIQPPEDPRDIEIPENVRTRVLLPPKSKRPPGRPRGKRIASFGEISGTKAKNKCGRCKGVGHNRTNCKNPI